MELECYFCLLLNCLAKLQFQESNSHTAHCAPLSERWSKIRFNRVKTRAKIKTKRHNQNISCLSFIPYPKVISHQKFFLLPFFGIIAQSWHSLHSGKRVDCKDLFGGSQEIKPRKYRPIVIIVAVPRVGLARKKIEMCEAKFRDGKHFTRVLTCRVGYTFEVYTKRIV